ncbi:hypothetical protein PoMZ_03523 [Pyricularia oryzae]|uniref:Uncharacterized protein n=1 Tax=Pyricularia oryzae TaxID=318829 RepID=A0A4P7N7F4_PYROR|nr:hypothetical protein PoMZ_03523 [Pyricularia oryzae]
MFENFVELLGEKYGFGAIVNTQPRATVINWAYFVRRYFERPKIDYWVVLKVKSYIAMKAPVKLVMVGSRRKKERRAARAGYA